MRYLRVPDAVVYECIWGHNNPDKNWGTYYCGAHFDGKRYGILEHRSITRDAEQEFWEELNK